MKTKRVVVELLSDRIDIVPISGVDRAKSRRIPIALEGNPGEWARAVRRAGATVRTTVDELGLNGAHTTVLYRSPTQSIDLSCFRGRPGEASAAARLACLDGLPYSTETAVCRSTAIGRDAQGRHMVSCADRNDIADSIAKFVEDAGLRFRAATPIDAALMSSLVTRALRHKSGLCGHVYLGERASFFIVVDKGRLIFARQIRLGIGALARSLTRPIRRQEGPPTELSHDEAWSILFEHGRPSHDTVVHTSSGLKGADITPVMQPVLQRMVVELRQSLRFGLTEEQRQQLSIELRGAGARIPGIPELIGEELGVAVSVKESGDLFRWSEPGCDSSEVRAAASSLSVVQRLNLEPPQAASRRMNDNLRRWLWTGTAAAVAVLAIDAFVAHQRLQETRRQAESMATASAGQDALRVTRDRLAGVVSAMGDLEASIDSEVGDRASLESILQEFAEMTPDSVRLISLTFSRREDATVGTVRGFAFDRGEGKTDLEQFVHQMAASPLLSNVALGNVQRGDMGGQGGEQFDATFSGIRLPEAGDASAVAAVAPGDAP